MNKMKYFFLLFIILFNTTNLFAQDKNYTIGKQNGYYWNSLESRDPLSTSKFNFLTNKLTIYESLRKLQTTDHFSDCRSELTKLYEEGKSDSVDLDFIIKWIDSFYSVEENLFIPVADAYCYCIKEIAGVSKEELMEYKKEIFERYKD
jgi:hypothetical protein